MASGNVLLYLPQDENADETFDKLKAAVDEAIGIEKYSFHRLTTQEATDSSAPWASTCVVLLVYNANEESIPEDVRSAFATYFRQHSGKLVFISNPEGGRKSVWFLKEMIKRGNEEVADASAQEWLETVGQTYEKFARGDTLPSNLQAQRIDSPNSYTDLSVGLVRADNSVCYLYMRSADRPDGATAVFLCIPSEVQECKGAWRDIMRLLGV